MGIIVITAIIAVIVTLAVSVPVTANLSVKKKTEKDAETIGTAEVKARGIIDEALKTAETKKREALLEAKEENLRTKNELEKETKERRAELQKYEKRVVSREEALDKKADAIEKREADYSAKEAELKKKEKNLAYENIENGNAKMIIGTHALIQEKVVYNNLGLVITDEQHRFGVRQREMLAQKGEEPHVLVMTATPIPRTLALILYGDLDISTINELPPGRQKVDTFAVNHTYDNRLYAFIEKETAKGRQCYIICPMIEENEKLDLRSVLKFTEELQNDRLPSLRVECMHGKLKNNEKQDIMDRFSNGEIDVLVSTTVIEVGVNVPNATLMIIENAERFGLSALHQLRGRVGRGGEKSYCVLVTDSKTKVAKERMTIMCKSNDGFVISEKDLHLRGPGDFFGTRQHGLPEMKIANLYKDINILKDVQSVAIDLYKSDENLEKKENLLLKKRIEELYSEENKKICL